MADTAKVIQQIRVLELDASEKNANSGKVGKFNHLRKVTVEEENGIVVMKFYSQKKEAPGQVLRFSVEDFRRFQQFTFPVVRKYEGIHGIQTAVPEYTNDKMSVGLDELGNPVLVVYTEDTSVRVSWQEIIQWAGVRIKLKKNAKAKAAVAKETTAPVG